MLPVTFDNEDKDNGGIVNINTTNVPIMATD